MRARAARFIAVVGISLCPASPPHAGNAQVSDTGYEIIPMIVTPSAHWVDSDHLLFVGASSVELRKAMAERNSSERVNHLRNLFLWDASSKSVKLYSDAKGVCIANGIVRYTVLVDKEAGKAVVREGPFGSEEKIEKPLPSAEELSIEGQMARVRSNLTCKTHLRSELVPPASKFRHVVVLREGDGYLDLGPSGGPNYFEERKAQPRNLVLYQAKIGNPIQLPMTWDENFSPAEIAYSSYRGAYVLRPRAPRGAPLGVSQPWPKGKLLSVYLLWANGRAESISIPYSPGEYLGHPQPIKGGWIFGGGNFYKSSGLYLFNGKTVSKIDAGLVKEIAASPDGCKAAVAIQDKHLDMGTPTNLRIFDFCPEGRNHGNDGGEGDDRLFGGDGNDSMTAGAGGDYLEGGARGDTLVKGKQAFIFLSSC